MAGSLNKVMLIGNVGRDPEMRYTQGGEPVTTFSLATNRRWTGQDGQPHEETEWHNIVAWRRLAEQCNEYLTKGRRIYVEGALKTRSWDDQATGQKKFRTEIVIHDMQMLDARPRDGEFAESGAGTGDGTGAGAPASASAGGRSGGYRGRGGA
jgi:single-strand DNA-binding protein